MCALAVDVAVAVAVDVAVDVAVAVTPRGNTLIDAKKNIRRGMKFENVDFSGDIQ